jgi:hypothetical protein
MNDIQPTCVECGRLAPPTDTNYTLISQRHGWRLVIEKTKDGRRASVWRCAECWSLRKTGPEAPASSKPAWQRVK